MLARVALAGWLALGGPAAGAGGEASFLEPDVEEDEDASLRERLTEREDERRPLRPWSVPVAGRPLTVSGEYELEIGFLRRQVIGEAVPEENRLLLEQEIEVEAFYSFGRPLSLFAQARVRMEEDLLPDTFEEVSDYYVERGEMWLISEDIGGSGVSVDAGRLDFEDDRRWWWDDELDAVRAAFETETLEISGALARELAPSRSDQSFVDPEHDRVLRVLGELSWEWSEDHALELFLVYHDDRAPDVRPGEVVSREREDDSNARLLWLGARSMGVGQLGPRGLLGYWVDVGWVRGRERFVEFEELSARRSVADEVLRRDVSGWGLDVGLSWILPWHLEPRFFGSYAFGSGDPDPEEGTDRSFRQTGLQANEAGFGGVERFPHYGLLLDPELSNLHVVTLGAGLSLLRSSSLDLVYHHFQLVEAASSLRDARIEVELDARHRHLGDELDLVLAVEEWERVEFDVALSAFRAGSAFGVERGTFSYGGFFAFRVAF